MHAEPDRKDLYRRILDLIPTPIFVIDGDLQILEHNEAARELLAIPIEAADDPHSGHILYCLNAVHRAEGCGRTPFCSRCGLRNALNASARGERNVHSRATLRLVENGQERERVFRISVAPFADAGAERWLLILDDRTEQAELERLFPLCSSCRQPRTDPDLRKQAEDYLQRHWDGDPTSCLCYDCHERLVGPHTAAPKAHER